MEEKKNYGEAEIPDTIEITLEDLEDVQQPNNSSQANSRVYGTVQEQDSITITWDDLNDTSVPTSQNYGAVPNYTNTSDYAKKGKKVDVKSVVYPAIVGLCGGFLAFLVNEPFSVDNATRGSGIGEMGLFLGIIGALIAGALACTEDIKSFVFEKAAKHFGCGALAGFVTGFIGGIIAQIIYAIMTQSGNIFVLWIARIFGWAVAGTFVGLSQSLSELKFNQKKLKNGLLGGVIGGAIGGALFDPISLILGSVAGSESHGGWLSRCVGITVMGGAIGYAIAFISETLKEAWIYITEGSLKGKQFILYEDETSFGSSPKCTVTIVKDPEIAPFHFIIENHKTFYALRTQASVSVNGRITQGQNLKDGDIIIAGKTCFKYEENAVKNMPA